MDIKYINPFLNSFMSIMPQLGINNIKKGKVEVKKKIVESPGVVIILGIVGQVRGKVIYTTTIECAKKIASIMMMGMPVNELDEMAQSAISELTNMLTGNAAMSFSNEGIEVDISTPTLMYGEFTANTTTDRVLCAEMLVEDMLFEVNIAIEAKNNVSI